jgi:general secretion pathway protein F
MTTPDARQAAPRPTAPTDFRKKRAPIAKVLAAAWAGRALPSRPRLAVIEQLSRLARSGVPIDPSLDRLAASVAQRRLAAAIRSQLDALRAGHGLGNDLPPPSLFAPAERGLLAAGERTGNVPEVLDRIAARERARLAVARRVLVGATYPVLLLVTSAFLLPLPVAFLKGVAPWLAESFATLAWIALAAITVMFMPAAVRLAHLGPVLRVLAWRLPVARAFYRRAVLSDATHVLGTALAAGLGVHESLALAGRASADPTVSRALADASRGLADGLDLGAALGRTGVLPAASRVTLAGAEQGGTLAAALDRLSGDLAMDLRDLVTVATRVLGVVLLLAATGLVAARVLGVASQALPGGGGSFDELERELMREMPIRPLR